MTFGFGTNAPTDPRAARTRGRARTFEKVFLLAALFLVLVTLGSWIAARVFSNFALVLVVDTFIFGLCYYLYLLWGRQAVSFYCDHCRAVILSNTPWACGMCGMQHLNGQQYPLLHPCAKCGNEAKSYQCHHCGKPIFFSADEDTRNSARPLGSPIPKMKREAKKTDQHREAKQQKVDNIELKNLDVEEARLDARLKAIQKLSEQEQGNPVLSKEKADLKKFMDANFAVEEAVREQKAANAAECKNDPQERRRRDLAAENWRLKHLNEE